MGIQIAQLFLSLSILIVLHEGGHYWAARWFKIRVEKFYLFFDDAKVDCPITEWLTSFNPKLTKIKQSEFLNRTNYQ